MFRLRCARASDLDDLHRLSQLVFFINLPSDKDVLAKKIALSERSFSRPDGDLAKNFYLFVLEDVAARRVVGTSSIHGKHGTSEIPHFFFKVSREQKYSASLHTGFIHGTLKFGVETDGWSEIGGLVLHPDYRLNEEKLGKQLSFVRFFYIALHRKQFTDHIHTELMPLLGKDGKSALWEAVGKRFLSMDYLEADALSRRNKEFILSLYPKDVIYQTLLPPRARDVIGRVGEATKPVVKMLESIGFVYTEEVDPFDGGPHYRARTAEIAPVKNLFQGVCHSREGDKPRSMLLQGSSEEAGGFVAFRADALVEKGKVFLNPADLQANGLQEGQKICGIDL